MLATLVDPARFRRLGISGRLRLRAVRRRQVRLAELHHRHRYPLPDSFAYYAQLNARPPYMGAWSDRIDQGAYSPTDWEVAE